MTIEAFQLIVGSVLALVFDLVPKINDWFGKLSKEQKRVFMVVANVLVAAALFGLSCASLLSYFIKDSAIACDVDGALALLVLAFTSVGSNQLTHFVVSYLKDRGKK